MLLTVKTKLNDRKKWATEVPVTDSVEINKKFHRLVLRLTNVFY